MSKPVDFTEVVEELNKIADKSCLLLLPLDPTNTDILLVFPTPRGKAKALELIAKITKTLRSCKKEIKKLTCG